MVPSRGALGTGSESPQGTDASMCWFRSVHVHGAASGTNRGHSSLGATRMTVHMPLEPGTLCVPTYLTPPRAHTHTPRGPEHIQARQPPPLTLGILRLKDRDRPTGSGHPWSRGLGGGEHRLRQQTGRGCPKRAQSRLGGEPRTRHDLHQGGAQTRGHGESGISQHCRNGVHVQSLHGEGEPFSPLNDLWVTAGSMSPEMQGNPSLCTGSCLAEPHLPPWCGRGLTASSHSSAGCSPRAPSPQFQPRS